MGILNQVLCTLVASSLCFIMGLGFAWPSSTMRIFQSENTTLDRPMGPTEISLFGSLSSIASSLCFIMGLGFAWPSSTMRIFQSENTTLDRPMGPTEISLFGSLSSIGALISTPAVGMFLDVVGRKNCALVAGLASVLSWTILATCSKVEAVLAAIFMSGIGGGSLLVVPVFIGEICQESIRGTLTSSSIIFYAIGMLASYLLGGLLEYWVMIYVCLSITVISMAFLLFLRESPLYLMKKGLDLEAQKSFAFYRNAAFDSKIVLQEMDTLRRAFSPVLDEDNETKPEHEKLNVVEQQAPEKVSLIQFIKKSRSTRRAMVTTLILVTAAIFQGLVVVQVYAEPLFQDAVPNMSSTLCSVLLAVTTIVAGFIAAYLTDIFGRKSLMMYASLGSCVCCVLLGTQIHLKWGPQWLTAAMIYSYASMYTLGAGTVPFVFLAEVFLPEVKSFMSMMVVEWAWLCNFIILFIFNPLVSALGLGPVFYFFSAVCLASAVYSFFCQPETKGLAFDEIQNAFDKRRMRTQHNIYE